MTNQITSLVYTDDNCVGCNKCVKACSCIGACVSVKEGEHSAFRINVDTDRCIACGACIDVCEHNARHYNDDTIAFFTALELGEDISVLIAPSFKANYPDRYEKVLGTLKELGVKHFINVAFGADIATWAYINYIFENSFIGGISQPCPAVVNYIEMYQPDLIPLLMPIQSPLLCAAIYAKKVLGITGKLAFISPCIAKKIEIDDPNTMGYVSYNVTFDHLINYLDKNHIMGEPASDEVEYGLGAFYPAPGGLSDYVKWLLGEDTFIRVISGKKLLYRYIKNNASLIKNRDHEFLFTDALNCENGCICGTAINNDFSHTDHTLTNLLKIKESVKNERPDSPFSKCLTPSERLAALNEHFKDLDFNDFIRKYTDKSDKCRIVIPNNMELQSVFMELHKYTDESKHMDCSYCGYDSCQEMATAIFNGINHKENCIHYLKSVVEDEQEMLKYRADHDEFLDIWNRRAAIDYLHRMLKEGENFSVIIADIDGFKGINETYGNAIADQLLVKLAWELKQMALSRKWIIARFGGDEFLIIIPRQQLALDSQIIEDLRYVFSTPISIGTETVSLTATLGISNSNMLSDVESIIMEAERALHDAKAEGKDKVSLYAEKLREQVKEEHLIMDKLKNAFENDGFFMVYQPQVDSKTKSVCGFEALVRMKEPGIYPGQFIPIAEKNGWIWRIGRITTRLVVQQLAKWRSEGKELHPVSINFSSNQLHDRDYIHFLENLLREYDIPAELVEIEITEGLFLDRTVQANDLFQHFKNLGIRLLMDDFGTGYSSLGYLSYIPVDVIKLDKSLVDNYLVDGKELFIRDVIKLMHDLDKEMIIEGVEEEWQFEKLREFEADAIQGYFFSKPLPPDEAIEFRVL